MNMKFRPKKETECQVSFLNRQCGSVEMFTDMKRKKQVVAQTLAIRDLTDASYLLYVSLFDIATTK